MSVEGSVMAAYGDNAFRILGIVDRALRHEPELKKQFFAEATSGDYEHLYTVCLNWGDAIDNDSLEDLRK
jgi:hypothetical protein